MILMLIIFQQYVELVYINRSLQLATNTMIKIPEIYIYIYLAKHRRFSIYKAQAKNSIKKGTGEDTGDKIQAT